jgi:hypothetical protein
MWTATKTGLLLKKRVDYACQHQKLRKEVIFSRVQGKGKHSIRAVLRTSGLARLRRKLGGISLVLPDHADTDIDTGIGVDTYT